MSTEKKLSCIDCAVANCNRMDNEFPDKKNLFSEEKND